MRNECRVPSDEVIFRILHFHTFGSKHILMKIIARFFTLFIFAAIISACVQEGAEQNKEAENMKITKEIFGTIGEDTAYLYTLENSNGMQVKITNYGGIVTSVVVPDRDGKLDDVVLGFEELEPYTVNEPYFGCIVGRYANRIALGKFSIGEEEYTLAQNNGINHLHGGLEGFNKKMWDAREKTSADSASLRLKYTSPDGEEGYPGNLRVMVTYSLTNENELIIDYRATTDKATPLNLTHHSYFNLSGGKKNILGHVLQLNADKYVVVNENLIPTGELRDVEGTPMDFRTPTGIGERIDQVEGGYDHTYVLGNTNMQEKVATFHHPPTGRYVEVFTTEPGIQFYTGNFLDGSLTGKKGIVYRKHFGFCLETQHFPDSPNQDSFPDVILNPGEEFNSSSIYKFGIKKEDRGKE